MALEASGPAPVVRIARSQRDQEQCFEIRRRVFIEEQGVSREEEFDEHDAECVHLLASLGDEPAGTARLRLVSGGTTTGAVGQGVGQGQEQNTDETPRQNLGKAQRVAVLADRRRDGIGRALMHALEREASARGCVDIVLHAQVTALPFYLALGYATEGEPFDEAGIPHRRMSKALEAHSNAALQALGDDPAYTKLVSHFGRLAHLQHVTAVLGWDEAVIMAEAAGPARGAAMATLRGVTHEIVTEPNVGEWLAAVDPSRLDAWQRANVREMRRRWRRATCLPAELVEASSRANMACEQAWRGLRPASDWRGLRPLLEEVVRLARERAAAYSEALGIAPYDALLDGFEPDMRSAELDVLFGQLRSFLPDFTQRVLEAQRSRPFIEPAGPFDPESQRLLGVHLMQAVGFDPRRGRLDVSHHPFCGGVPEDVRITTRYDEDDFASSLMAVLHETGHAMYEQGRPQAWLDQPVGEARSMGVHESQSLLREMQLARSAEFFDFAAPVIRELLGDTATAQPEAFEAANLYRFCTRVQPDFIRVDADEVTYPSHILLRYEIERQLIEGGLEVRSIPELWDEKMFELLGLRTGDHHVNGCMQDVHWAAGLFGYFPTYTLGAVMAAQIFAAAERDIPNARERIRRGDFAALNGWLRLRLWSLGSSLTSHELMLEATGESLDVRHFLAHLERRYLAA